MARCRWVICCERFEEVPDVSGGFPRASLYGVSDRIKTTSMPAITADIYVVFRVDAPELDPLQSHHGDMVVTAPSGTAVAQIRGRHRVDMAGQAIWPYRLNAPNAFSELGWYLVSLSAGGVTLCHDEPLLCVLAPGASR